MTGARCSLPSPVLFGKCEKASRLNEVCLRWLRYQSGLSRLVCLGLFSLCQRLHADMSFCIFLHRVSRIVMARSNRRVFSFSSIKFMIHLAVKNVTEQFLFSFVFKCLWVMGTTLFLVTWTVYSSSFLLSQSLSFRSDGLRSCGCVKEGGIYFQEMFWELDAFTTGSLICVWEFQVGHMWQQPAVAFFKDGGLLPSLKVLEVISLSCLCAGLFDPVLLVSVFDECLSLWIWDGITSLLQLDNFLPLQVCRRVHFLRRQSGRGPTASLKCSCECRNVENLSIVVDSFPEDFSGFCRLGRRYRLCCLHVL